MRVAAVQLNSGNDKDRNLEVAARLVAEAAADGAQLDRPAREVEPARDGRASSTHGAEGLDGAHAERRRLVGRRALGIWVLAGSIAERRPGADRLFNTSCLIDPAARRSWPRTASCTCSTSTSAGVSYRESEREQPGDELVVADVGRRRAGAQRLLRPPVPGAVSDPRRARRPTADRALGVHDADRARSLGGAAAGPGDREPGVRARPEPVRARRRPTTTPTGARRSSIPGGTVLARPPTVRASSPPTSTSHAAGGDPLLAAVARQPPPRRLRWPEPRRGGADDLEGTARRPPAADPRRGDPRLRPPGLQRLPGLRHRPRGERRLRARLPLLQLQGPGAQRALRRALVAAARRDRGGGRARDPRPARSSTRSPASSSAPTATTPS